MADWTPAWEEAIASCPTDKRVLDTLELQHPAILLGGVIRPLRMVNDVIARSLGIELSGAFDPGDMVEFSPSAFGAAFPEYSEGQVPTCEISMDNVGRDMAGYLEAALGYNAELKAIFRQYSLTEPGEPIYGPIEFTIRNVRVSGTRITGAARVSNLADKKFPTRVYTRARFPGLVR